MYSINRVFHDRFAESNAYESYEKYAEFQKRGEDLKINNDSLNVSVEILTLYLIS